MMDAASSLLFEHVRDLPFFRGLLRAIESRAYQQVQFESPVLDLGCGDGHFAQVTFADKIAVAIDPLGEHVREAHKRNIYGLVTEGTGVNLPFPDGYFASAFSNSVLEHISDPNPVLAELARVVRPGGLFVFCVPNDKLLSSLAISQWMEKYKLRKLAKAYRYFFNKVSRHYTSENIESWTRRLSDAGFMVEKAWDIIPRSTFRIIEIGHYLGIPSWILRKTIGVWNIVRHPANFAPLLVWLQNYYVEPTPQTDGVYSFYITRRRVSEPK